MISIRAIFLVGLYFVVTQSILDLLTTSHVNVTLGERGNNRRNIKPKEHFCSEGKVEKLRCRNRRSDACRFLGSVVQGPVCGFDNLGVKFEFKRQCEACENHDIKYYFRGTCDKIPKICSKSEECVNGLCVQLLNDPEDNFRTVCNSNFDCSSASQLCVANKCIDRAELVGKLKNAQRNNPRLAQKHQRVRREAMRFEQSRRRKDIEQIQKLRAEIANRRQARANRNNRNPNGNTTPNPRRPNLFN